MPSADSCFDEGNYAMFIHWGLYSQLANKVDGKTYYGIGEWIMNRSMAGIPVDEYQRLAGQFNPVKFDAMAIAQLAKDAGMKYIVITSKHHDGFAMYHSKACEFNIVDATPWKKDPDEGPGRRLPRRRDSGSGSTIPTIRTGPSRAAATARRPTPRGTRRRSTTTSRRSACLKSRRSPASMVPIEIVWFDTPGKMPKQYVEQLVEVVRKNQPHALVSGRAGHDLGDYQTLGDMEVPRHNVEGLWESVDTTNDSWAYAWYDENWKSPEEILHRLIACVGRGGTYMLNIGPRGDGSVPRAGRPLAARSRRVDPSLSASRLRDRRLAMAACPAVGRCDAQGKHAVPGGVRVASLRQALSARPQNADPVRPSAERKPERRDRPPTLLGLDRLAAPAGRA